MKLSFLQSVKLGVGIYVGMQLAILTAELAMKLLELFFIKSGTPPM